MRRTSLARLMRSLDGRRPPGHCVRRRRLIAAADDDRRLRGQERCLLGATPHLATYTRPRPAWDHDHCAFCWAKLMEEDHPEVHHEGYNTEDEYRWVCLQCFEDFRERFRWSVREPS